MNQHLLGMHLSGLGSPTQYLTEACALGMNTFQVFTRSNRNINGKSRWANTSSRDFFNEYFRQQNKISKWVVHATYINNFCTADKLKRNKYIQSMKEELRFLNEYEGDIYYVVHPGSATDCSYMQGLNNLIDSIEEMKSDLGKVVMCLETMAGAGNQVMFSYEQCKYVMDALSCDNIGLCYDTCHVFGAGYDVCEYYLYLQRFVKVIHMNNSKAIAGSRKDSHDNLEYGQIPLDTLKRLFQYADKNIPIILETPVIGMEADYRILKNFD